MNHFKEKNIAPMLMKKSKPFNDLDFIFEIKFDGIRAIIYIENNQITIKSRNNRDMTSLFPELHELFKNSKKDCILDGEIIILEKDKPNFFAVQKRCLMTNKTKINKLSKENPAIFVAFDILYYDQNDLVNLPLIKRKCYLNRIKEENNLIISKYIEEKGKELFKKIKKEKLEGIVAKKKESIYEIGKRVDTWVKIKAVNEEDFYIVGLKEDKMKIKSIVLATIKKNKFIYCGDVNIPNVHTQERLHKFKKNNIINKAYFDLKNITWLKPTLRCSVRYLEKSSSGHLRHPIFLKFID